MSLSFCLAICEWALRSYGLGNPLIYYNDPAYGYALQPSQKSVRLRDSVVTINESGLRSVDNWRSAKGRRILFMGDSVTYGGSYIDDSEIFSTLVCEVIPDSTCGNAGVNGYGVFNMVMRSRVDHNLRNSDLVVFTVVPGDFIRGLTTIDHVPYYVGKPSGWLHRKFPALSELVNHLGYSYGVSRFISKSKNNIMWNPQDHSLEATQFALDRLFEEITRLEASGKDVFVFLSPDKEDLEFKGMVATVVDRALEDRLRARYLPGRFMDEERFYYDNIHYEVEGHQRAAEQISELIMKTLVTK